MSTGERARLFVALELPEAVRDALSRWREGALGPSSGLRLTAVGQLHATLCFLGWRHTSDVDSILEVCQLLVRNPSAELALGPAAWLPARRPRVLAVELEDLQGTLTRVQATLSAALADGGWYVPEKRPFLAHVTVARVPRGVRPRPRELPSPPSRGLRASQVTLFRSRLGPAGARYEPLGGVQLGS